MTLKLAKTLCYTLSQINWAPQSDDGLNNDARIENNHYRQKYAELPEPVVFMTVAASTS